jgi:hypothetical protein
MERFASPAERLLLACHQGDADAARAIVAEYPGIVERLGPVERQALTDEAWAANAPAVELMLELGFDPSVPVRSAPKAGMRCIAPPGKARRSASRRYSAGRPGGLFSRYASRTMAARR